MFVSPASEGTGAGRSPDRLGPCVTGVLLWRAGRRGISAAAIAVLVLSLAAAVAAPVVAADDDCPTDTTTTARRSAPQRHRRRLRCQSTHNDDDPDSWPHTSPTPTPTPAPVPPNAVDDTAAAEAGVPVTIVTLANDTGDGPGIVRHHRPCARHDRRRGDRHDHYTSTD